MSSSNSPQPTAQPPAPYLRIQQMDVMRGFAVLGIYWINIFVFALPGTMQDLDLRLHDSGSLNSFIAYVSDTFIEGSMRGLFSLLFGASALIFLSEARLAASGTQLVDHYYRRTLLLILFGVIHAYFLLWPYDVLYDYGVLGLFLFPLRKLRARTLMAFGFALLLVGDLAMVDAHWIKDDGMIDKTAVIDTSTPGDPETYTDNLPGEQETPGESVREDTDPEPPVSDDAIEEVVVYRSGYVTIYDYQKELVINQQSSAFYTDYLYDIGGMMLIGMALFKLGVMSGQLTQVGYLLLAIFGFGSGLLVRGVFSNVEMLPMIWFSELMLRLGGAYNIGRFLITLGYVGLLGLVCRNGHTQFISRTLAPVGRMALTNYILQTVISLFLFYGMGLALFAQLERYQIMLVCVGVWVIQVILSHLWLTRYKQGPLEWIWRSLIYGTRQSNRKTP